jgi:glutaredoxin
MTPPRAPRARPWTAAIATIGALVALVVGTGIVAGPVAAQDDELITITLFRGEGCPHCAAEEAFLEGLVLRHPEVVVDDYEVWYDADNRARFAAVAAAHGIEAESVPTTFLGDRHWVGFNDDVGAQIESAVVAELEARRSPSASSQPSASPSSIEIPFVGPVDAESTSLVAVTGLIALVDGFNPCSLWVLSVLLAMMLHSGSRRRLVAVGVTFLLVAGAAYGVFMLGLFAALDWVGYGPAVRIGIAAIVGGLGVLAIRDFVATGPGFSTAIPESGKRDITRRSRALALSTRSLRTLVPLTALLAAGVSLLELPCTAGFPVMWNGILAERGVAGLEFAALLALYLGIYLLDELLLFAAAATTMRVTKMQEHHGRALKLVAGTLMVALAGVMLVAPDLLDSLGGALAVFGIAIGVAAAALAGQPFVGHGARNAGTVNAGDAPAPSSEGRASGTRSRRTRARRRAAQSEG